jgi:hypothetical protein
MIFCKIKFSFISITLLTAASICTADFSKTIRVTSKPELVLIKDGQSKARIVVTENSAPVVKFAAKELQQFLKQATGVSLKQVKRPEKGTISIILGDNQFSRKLGVNVSSLPRDGFIIKTIGNNVVIAGKDDPKQNPAKSLKRGMWANHYQRATLFGVYDFLERFTGCRFFFPGKIGTVVPKRKVLTVPHIDIADAPDYTSRSYSRNEQWLNGPLSAGDHYQRYLNSFRLRFQTDYIPNCHGLNKFAYLKRFAKTHPEYFALNANGKRMTNPNADHAGQLCLSSHIVNEIRKDAAAFLTGKPASSRGINTKYGSIWIPSACKKGYFNIMPQDAFYLCRCEQCQKHYSKGKQATSEYIWKFYNETGKYLKDRGIKGTLTTMAYPPYRKLPKTEIPDNILVKVAERGPWHEHLPQIQQIDDAEIKSWTQKLGRKIDLWTYANKFGNLSMPGVPSMTPRCIGKYFKRQKDYIIGAYMESESDKFIYNYLNYYIFCKISWDTSLDVDKLLNDHYQAMFGPAAIPMRKIFERFEHNWTHRVFGKPYTSSLGPTTAPASEFELWERIYSPDELKELNKQFDTAEKMAVKNPEALARVKFMRKEFMEPLLKNSKIYFARKQAATELAFNVKPLPLKKKINIDGNLNDPAWKNAYHIHLTPYKKEAGERVSTTVKALRDKEMLYLAFDCREPDMKNIFHGKRKRDDSGMWQDNSVEVFLNPSGDKKNYYHFIINSAGSYCDAKSTKVGSSQKEDYSWNSGALIKTTKSPNGWSVEMAIPIKNKSSNFPANFCRSRVLIKGKNYVKNYTWSPYLKRGFHDLDNFGKIYLDQSAPQNIIKDHNFSDISINDRWIGKWIAPRKKDLTSGKAFSLDKKNYVIGGQSLKLTNNSPDRIVIVQPVAELKPDTLYRLSYYVKTKDVKPLTTIDAGVCANIWDGKNHWFPKNRLLGTIPWSRQVFEFRTSKAKSGKKYKGTLRLFLLNATGSAWFDNITLVKINDK